MGSARHAPTLPVEQRASTGQKGISSVTRKRKLLEPVRQSLPERAIACRAYLQSCLPYAQQIVPPVPVKQRSLHAQCARFVLGGRHWIEAQHIDGVFRLFRLPQPGTWRTSGPLALCGFVLRLAPHLALAAIAGTIGVSSVHRPVLYKMLLKLLRTLQVQASSPLVPTLRDNARQLLRSPRLTATDIRPVQQLYKRILLENEDAAARKYLLDKISKLPWAGPAMSWLPSVLLCPSSLTLAVSRAYALRWITGEEADARFVYRIHFSRPEVCAHCNQNMPKDQLYRFGCTFQGSYCPGCLAQLRVPLERLWSVLWCPELDGHLLRPTEAWVSPAAAPPVRQDGPLPASALAYLEHPCLPCGTAENSVCHWLQSCPVLCLAARLLGVRGFCS